MNFTYSVKLSRRARAIRIYIHPNLKVEVVTPVTTEISAVDEFVLKKAEWIKRKLAYFAKHKIIFIKKTDFSYRKNHNRALKMIHRKIFYYNNSYKFSVGKISVRDQKSRWGSCSRRGNLSFSYKIVFLPQALVNYLIVHELCHLKEFNHSKNFWALVSQTIPNYSVLRKEIKLVSVSPTPN